MARIEAIFVCGSCGTEYGKWQGQCGACGEWNSLKEVSVSFQKGKNGAGRRKRREKIESVKLEKVEKRIETTERILTGLGEFDRVLGKGFVQGGVVLFAGEPGIGKSTLVTQVMGGVGGLYVAGEESPEQILMRVERLGLKENLFEVLAETETEEVVDFLSSWKGKLVIIDSIQTMYCTDLPGGAGSPNQIKEAALRLIRVAKKQRLAMVIVGHVTKGGEIAGPKLLEHMVDTVIYFEGERLSELRLLRCSKNRFGPTDEVGVFKMEKEGLKEVVGEDLSLVEGKGMKVGAAQTIVIEGNRPMLLEVQALVTESFAPVPRRVFSGVDYNRGQLLVAVVQKALKLPFYKYDIFVAVTGGVRIVETGADLAVVAALWSSYANKALSGKRVFVGEVSLLGEVKRVRNWERRAKEAKNLGREMVGLKTIRELKR